MKTNTENFTILQEKVRRLKGEGRIKYDKEIAKAMGYLPGTVSSYISGKKEVSAEFLREFDKIFNMNSNNNTTSQDGDNNSSSFQGNNNTGSSNTDVVGLLKEISAEKEHTKVAYIYLANEKDKTNDALERIIKVREEMDRELKEYRELLKLFAKPQLDKLNT